MPRNYFDARIAQSSPERWPEIFRPEFIEPSIDFLAELADGGAALELGVGTGRLALPLSARGIRVVGIDLSPEMVAELRSQPGADAIDVTIGDFATTRVDGAFTLAYLVRNTIMNLTSQDAQVQCFRNTAAHLQPGGYFVIEVIVPLLQRLPRGERFHVFTHTDTHLAFDEIDVVTQESWSHHYWNLNGETDSFSAPFRYVWPAELDLMARLAGLTLRERWADWHRNPFTAESPQHISVWEKTGEPPALAL